jgi:hypothetical protein
MLEKDRLKTFLTDNDIINMNVIGPMIDRVADDVAGDAATFRVVATPVAAPVAGSVLIGDTVALTCATADSTIYYTTNGDTPDDESAVYTSPIAIPAAETIKAIGYKGYRTASNVLSAAYTITKAATPVADPVAGAVADNSEIVLTCATAGSTIYYTVNGDAPTNASTLYEDPIVITDNMTVKAIAYAINYAASNVLSAAYTIAQVATPVADPGAGEVADNTEVTLTCATSGATIYYTTNGDTPTAASTEYTTAIIITDPVTIKAIGIKEDYVDSAVLTAAYTIAS